LNSGGFSPDPIVGFRDPTTKGREERKGTGGTGPLSQIPGSAPVQ